MAFAFGLSDFARGNLKGSTGNVKTEAGPCRFSFLSRILAPRHCPLSLLLNCGPGGPTDRAQWPRSDGQLASPPPLGMELASQRESPVSLAYPLATGSRVCRPRCVLLLWNGGAFVESSPRENRALQNPLAHPSKRNWALRRAPPAGGWSWRDHGGTGRSAG